MSAKIELNMYLGAFFYRGFLDHCPSQVELLTDIVEGADLEMWQMIITFCDRFLDPKLSDEQRQLLWQTVTNDYVIFDDEGLFKFIDALKHLTEKRLIQHREESTFSRRQKQSKPAKKTTRGRYS